MGKVQITEDSFGRTKQPGNDVKFEPVRRFTLSNSDGVRVQVCLVCIESICILINHSSFVYP